jgi:CheY-like chemotaxis protein
VNGDRPQVLLVDDDSSNRLVCSIALEGLGFDVLTASEGMEALDYLDEYTPDVIMLDLRMPGMDGWQFLGHYNGPVPIVIVSAWADDRPLVREPFAVISKPCDMREVAVMLRQAVRSRRNLS